MSHTVPRSSTESASKAVAVTPDNTVNFTDGECRALYVGVSGDIVGVVNGTPVTFTAVPVGILPVRFTRINSTSTTAASMVALY